MDKKQLSNRALGKLLDPPNPERGRRQVLRHLSGKHYPSTAYRKSYGELLGDLPEMFADDDDEEADPVSLVAELHDMARAHRDLAKRADRLRSALSKESA